MKIDFEDFRNYLIVKRDSYVDIGNKLKAQNTSKSRIEHFYAKADGVNEVIIRLEYLYLKQVKK